VLLIWSYDLAHSGTAVSLVGLAEVLPLLVLTPFGGVLIDRLPRALVMTGGMAAAALLLLPLPLVAGDAALPTIIGAALLVNAAVQLSYAASSAALPIVARDDELSAANSLTSVILGGGAVVAPGLGALLAATVSPSGAALVLAALFAAAGIAYRRVPAPRVQRTDGSSSFREDLLAGFAYVFHSRLLLSLFVLTALTSLAFGGLSVIDIVFVTRILRLPASNVGLLLSAAGVGELAGGIAMTMIAGRLDRVQHRVLAVSIAIAGIGFVLYSASRVLAAATVALTLASLSYPPLNVAFATLRQRATSDEFMGRVGGLARSTMGLAMVISLAGVGGLTDAFGVRVVILGGGVLLLGCGALSVLLVGERT
jgi:hypothetical protein